MSKEITKRFKKLILQDDEHAFYVALEKKLTPLRQCASGMADFIHQLPKRTEAFDVLESCYRKLESMPVCDLCEGICAIKDGVAKVNFYFKDQLIMRQADVVVFFEKQNQFNAEANRFVATAMVMDSPH